MKLERTKAMEKYSVPTAIVSHFNEGSAFSFYKSGQMFTVNGVNLNKEYKR